MLRHERLFFPLPVLPGLFAPCLSGCPSEGCGLETSLRMFVVTQPSDASRSRMATKTARVSQRGRLTENKKEDLPIAHLPGASSFLPPVQRFHIDAGDFAAVYEV